MRDPKQDVPQLTSLLINNLGMLLTIVRE